ncbi:hypothetical protein YWS52_32480 [Chitiniphilus shinanonensis]
MAWKTGSHSSQNQVPRAAIRRLNASRRNSAFQTDKVTAKGWRIGCMVSGPSRGGGGWTTPRIRHIANGWFRYDAHHARPAERLAQHMDRAGTG